MKFHKMSGAGNDFVLISGRPLADARLKELALSLCAAKSGIGADGLLYAAPGRDKRIKVRYFNSDGSEAFCGNGSRCAAWWAYSTGAVKAKRFELATAAGILPAEVTGNEKIRLRMPAVASVSLGFPGDYPAPVKKVHFLNTGVPHAVVPLKELASLDVDSLGRRLRHNKAFGQAGANVDFVAPCRGGLAVRTYERGVEAETLACGTGITAAAIAMGMEKKLSSPVRLRAKSGELFKVWFKAGTGYSADGIYLEGPARIVFEGEIRI